MKLLNVTVTFLTAQMGDRGISGWIQHQARFETSDMSEALAFVAGITQSMVEAAGHVRHVRFGYDYTGMVAP